MTCAEMVFNALGNNVFYNIKGMWRIIHQEKYLTISRELESSQSLLFLTVEKYNLLNHLRYWPLTIAPISRLSHLQVLDPYRC